MQKPPPFAARVIFQSRSFETDCRANMKQLRDGFSYPPRGMSREEAARYIGVGTTKFDQLVLDKRMPKPRRIDGRVIWGRLAPDVAFTDLPEDAQRRNYFDT